MLQVYSALFKPTPLTMADAWGSAFLHLLECSLVYLSLHCGHCIAPFNNFLLSYILATTHNKVMGRQRKERIGNAFSAEHYERRRNQLGKIGVVKKKHSPSTKNNINEISLRWKM